MTQVYQKNQDIFAGTACGKTILVGEHAAVYGAHAIAIPLKQMQTKVVLKKTKEKDFKIQFNNPVINEKVLPVVQEAFQILEGKFEYLSLTGESNIPIGAGLGSSAALCVSLVKAIDLYLGRNLSNETVSNIANQLEKRFHGNPSGLDTTVISHEKIVLFKKGESPRILEKNSKNQLNFLYFAVINTNISSSTELMVENAQPYFLDNNDNIKKFDTITLKTARALDEHNVNAIGENMNKCHKLLQDAGVSTPLIQQVINDLLAFGCKAAKITGAGGGGCILALLDADIKNKTLEKIIKNFGNSNVYEVNL